MFTIFGKYQGQPWEEIDTANDKQECDYLLGEYRMAFGPGWTFKIKRAV